MLITGPARFCRACMARIQTTPTQPCNTYETRQRNCQRIGSPYALIADVYGDLRSKDDGGRQLVIAQKVLCKTVDTKLVKNLS